MRHRAQSSLHRSPFAVLGVTIRDGQARIIEAADERSLVIGDDAGQQARSRLTNPRLRLAEEMAWLPGLSPSKASELLKTLETDAHSLRLSAGLPVLSHLNLLSAALEAMGDELESIDLADFICEIAALVSGVHPADILRDINEERSISGFAQVKDVSQVEAEFAERKRHYRDIIKNALNRLPADKIVETMREAVDNETVGGHVHASELLDDLVDSYEVDVQGFLEAEAGNIHRLLDAISSAAPQGQLSLNTLVEKLEAVAHNWDRVAQPIQLSAKARGIRHEASHDVAFAIRSVAIDLWNQHGLLEQSQKLTELAQELFSELPEFSDRVEQDLEALTGIQLSQQEAARESADWERDISYSAEMGLIFKDQISISPSGVSWKGQSFALDKITRVRWGATVHRVNGIKTGTTYTFGFGDDHREAVGNISNANIFETFIEKLWKAVCVRLLHELVLELRSGRELSFGGGKIRDDGIIVIKHKFLGKNEPVFCPWWNTQIYSADGQFFIRAKDDSKAYVSSSYIQGRNTHIFEQLIRMAYKVNGMKKLSDILG